MILKENIPLAEYTTFKIGGPARFFCQVSSEDELVEAIRFAKESKLRVFILGGGSNLLISDKGFPGLVIKMEIKGVSYEPFPGGSDGEVLVQAGAGEVWDELVSTSVERGLYGIENLSAIPGTVGAAPVQNIGAYGTDASQTVVSVRAFDRKKLCYVELSAADCRFGYRDSLFLQDRTRYAVTRVSFKLSSKGAANVGYRDVKEYFDIHPPTSGTPTLAQVREAVIDIRWNKLPDWHKWGTAGSFFKNPLISARKFAKLQKKFPGIVGYPDPDGRVKVALGWVLENICKAKDLCVDGARVYEKQALVLVVKPGATAAEVVALAQKLMKEVKKQTGISITGEVEWVN